jgi:hypothetical protein
MTKETIWPTENDVGQVGVGVGAGRIINESGWTTQYKHQNNRGLFWHDTGFNQTQSLPVVSTDFNIAKGRAIISGFNVDTLNEDSAHVVSGLSSASTMYRVWLKYTVDGGGLIDGYEFEARSDTTIPVRAMLLYEVWRNASSQLAAAWDRRPGLGCLVGEYDSTGDRPNLVVCGFRPRVVQVAVGTAKSCTAFEEDAGTSHTTHTGATATSTDITIQDYGFSFGDSTSWDNIGHFSAWK